MLEGRQLRIWTPGNHLFHVEPLALRAQRPQV
jgi:hypothetical protein